MSRGTFRGIAALVCAAALAAVPATAMGQQPPNPLGCDSLDPSVCLYPFPNDHFTRADPSTATGRRVDFQLAAMPRNVAGVPVDPTDYNRADGFSPGQMVVTKIPGFDTQAAFERTGAVPITDMARSFDPDQPIVVLDADTGERHLIWAEIDWNAGCHPSTEPEDGPCNPGDAALLIRPGKNWIEGHRYIVALRNLKDADGNKLEPGPAFKAYRDGEAAPSPLDVGFEQRRPHMEEIFETLAEAGIGRKELHLAWDFTVASGESLAGRMLHIRDDAFAQLGDTDLADLEVEGRAPAFTVTDVTDYTPEQDANVAREVTGTFTVPCYLDKPLCLPANSRFLLDPQTGMPTQLPGNTYEANFYCKIPHWALDAEGNTRPTRPSLYGHGLLGGASELNAGNVETFGNEHGISFCATDWIGMATTDLPNVATILFELGQFPTLADRVQQGMLNFLYLGRLMVHPDGLNADPAFELGGEGVLDTTRLFYDGNSQGGIIGGALTAVAVDYTRAVLGVPGMNYSTLLRRSVDFVGKQDTNDIDPTDPLSVVDYAGYSGPMYAAYPNELERPLLLSMVQMLWDRAEANGYAQHMTADPYPNTPAHDVLLHPAFGDHQVAQVSAEVEARTIGARVLRKDMVDPGHHTDVDPYYGIPEFDSFPGTGSALVVWDSGDVRTLGDRVFGTGAPPTANIPPRPEWGYGVDPHAHPRSTPSARVQKSEFLKIDGAVVDVCDGGPCRTSHWFQGR